MADALVRELNRLGYQPVFLPQTGVEPPELYNYSRQNQRLVRRGPLGEYLPRAGALPTTEGDLADITYKYTSEKKLDAAVSFLESALRCIGIDAVPKIDLGFAGSKDFSFAFTGVTYRRLDPAKLDQVIRDMGTAGIPQSIVDAGLLHVAYEYAYARELLMSRGDRKAFSHDIAGKVGAYLDIGVKGSVSVASQSTIAFKSTSDQRAAFAYKAARLAQEDNGWVLYPEEVATKGLVEERTAFIPQPAIVLTAETIPPPA
jgi:hypothetical protein